MHLGSDPQTSAGSDPRGLPRCQERGATGAATGGEHPAQLRTPLLLWVQQRVPLRFSSTHRLLRFAAWCSSATSWPCSWHRLGTPWGLFWKMGVSAQRRLFLPCGILSPAFPRNKVLLEESSLSRLSPFLTFSARLLLFQ